METENKLVPARVQSRAYGRPGITQVSPPEKKPRRVLLVEDDTELRRMLSASLRRDGYAVLEARDGTEAIECLLQLGAWRDMLSLVVSDIRLPYFSGLEILEAVRWTDSKLPVFLITAFGDDETHAAAHRLGADLVLDKPFDVDDLRAAVRAAVPL